MGGRKSGCAKLGALGTARGFCKPSACAGAAGEDVEAFRSGSFWQAHRDAALDCAPQGGTPRGGARIGSHLARVSEPQDRKTRSHSPRRQTIEQRREGNNRCVRRVRINSSAVEI